jgi:hypothetical protein
VGGEGFAAAASLIHAEANKSRSIPGAEWNRNIDPETAKRAVREYLATLDDPAYGAASEVTPKFVSPSDPASQWTGALKSAAFFAYADIYTCPAGNKLTTTGRVLNDDLLAYRATAAAEVLPKDATTQSAAQPL